MSHPTPNNHCDVKRINESAFLLNFTPADQTIASEQTQTRIWSLAGWIDSQRNELGILEAVPGMGNLLVQFADSHRTGSIAEQHATIAQLLDRWRQDTRTLPTSNTIHIPVCYGGEYGPDLDNIAAVCGLPTHEIIARHCAASYRVYCIGFQPGFAYLGGLEPALHCPRKTTPNTGIPAGSVAIGGSQTGIYPFASPGGWQIIGRTDLTMFDPQSIPASRLQAGDEVRFTQVTDL